jgi:hypothetical protein
VGSFSTSLDRHVRAVLAHTCEALRVEAAVRAQLPVAVEAILQRRLVHKHAAHQRVLLPKQLYVCVRPSRVRGWVQSAGLVRDEWERWDTHSST